jgi:hypothetical protein
MHLTKPILNRPRKRVNSKIDLRLIAALAIKLVLPGAMAARIFRRTCVRLIQVKRSGEGVAYRRAVAVSSTLLRPGSQSSSSGFSARVVGATRAYEIKETGRRPVPRNAERSSCGR